MKAYFSVIASLITHGIPYGSPSSLSLFCYSLSVLVSLPALHLQGKINVISKQMCLHQCNITKSCVIFHNWVRKNFYSSWPQYIVPRSPLFWFDMVISMSLILLGTAALTWRQAIDLWIPQKGVDLVEWLQTASSSVQSLGKGGSIAQSCCAPAILCQGNAPYTANKCKSE